MTTVPSSLNFVDPVLQASLLYHSVSGFRARFWELILEILLNLRCIQPTKPFFEGQELVGLYANDRKGL